MAALLRALTHASIVSAITFSAAQSASAAPITWWIGGPVYEFPDPYHAVLEITWEPETISGVQCPPGSGVYDAILSATLSLDEAAIQVGGGAIEVSAPLGNCGSGGTSVEFRMFHHWSLGSPLSEVNLVMLFPWPTNASAPDLYGILGPATWGSVDAFGPYGEWLFGFSGPIYSSRPLQPEPIPEPASLILFGTGLIGAAAWRRRGGGSPRKR